VAQVFQFPVVYDTMTVYDNLAFPLRNLGKDKATIDRRVREIASALELDSDLMRKANNLSADDKQKVSMGRGLTVFSVFHSRCGFSKVLCLVYHAR
jgi:glycerol transport system ATP-binding protein